MNTLLKIVLSCAAFNLIASSAFAEAPENKGLTIATEADNRDNGFGDFTADLKMVLRNKQGEESLRDMRSKTLEVDSDGDKSLTIFDRPDDVSGTALLTFTHKVGNDDQWLYLPALKRVKRIASNNKSGPFMGSEFAYEDISSQEVEKYTYKFIKEEQLDNEDMYVLERYPVDKKSGYTKQIVWLDKSEYRERKIDYFDRKGAHLKTLVFSDYQQYLDKFWRASTMDMQNHQTGKSTTLSWSDFKFGNGLSERDFDRNSLKRAQ